MEPERLDRGYRQVGYAIEVDATPAQVFALVADPRRHHEFDGSGMVGQRVLMPETLHVGATFTVAMHLGKLPYSITSSVTAFDPDRLIEWQHPQGHRWRYELQAQPTSTRILHVWNYSFAFAPFTLEWAGFPRRNARAIHASLVRLRDLLAAAPTAT